MTLSFLTYSLAMILAIVAVTATLWVGARWPLVRDRRWGRWILAAEVLVFVTPASVWFVNVSVSQGDYLCERCGTVDGSARLFSVRLGIHGDDPEHPMLADAREYASTFPLRDAAQHQHEWRPIGCHSRGGIYTTEIGCFKGRSVMWFHDLPLVADRALAIATVDRFVTLPLLELRELLDSYPLDPGAGDSPDARFRAWRAAWRSTHPDWP